MNSRDPFPDEELRRRIMDFIMAAGQTLLENGAEVFRAFCFAMMFGGSLRSALAAAGAGLVASWYLLWCGRHEVPGGFQKISTAALITLVCILLCNLLHTSASHAIIGTLMILTPGIAFTMGIRDFVQGDYLSGTIRMIDALLIAASIAIGTGLVLRLYTVLTGVVVV